MSDATLALGAALGLACGALFVAAGARTWRRALEQGSPPLRAFAVFWLGSGAYIGADAAWRAAWLGGEHSLLVAVAVLQVKVAAVCAGFAGLVVYLLAIYSPRRLRLRVAAAYFALFLALETFYTWRGPVGAYQGYSSLGLDYARSPPPFVWDALLVALFLPPLLATLGYASLYRLAPDGAAKRRIALTSGSLLLFFVPDLARWLVGGWEAWDLVERGLALGAGGVILAATRPGGPKQRRLPDADLAQRARELI